MRCVVLPWPDRALHPNAREHWSKRAKAAKKARRDAGYAAMEAGLRSVTADSLRVTAVFFPPDRQRRDLDGLLTCCKPVFDGIADATGIDDSKFAIGAPRWGDVRKGGAVHIEVEVVKA